MVAVIRRPSVFAVSACLAAALLTAPAGAEAPLASPLATRLTRALAVPHVPPSRSAAVAVDLATGKTVYSRHGGLGLVPASNEKLAVTFAALVALGPSFRIETVVLGRGRLRGSVWDGDLILKGQGDPTLSAADLKTLAANLRLGGIRRVTGRVVGDESFFDYRRTAPGWKWWYYLNESPPLSALVVDRGKIHGFVSRSPASAAALLFNRALRSAGVAVRRSPTTGRAGSAALPLASVLSPPLKSIVRYMDRESDNFTAELLLKQLGALEFPRGTTARGAAAVRRLLGAEGIPLAGVRIVDGSGLSRLNRLTANSLVAILREAWLDPTLRTSFRSALAVAGRNGTLERRLRQPPVVGRVYAKTGTTSESSSLAGFVGRRYAFAVIQNGSPVSHWWARRAQDRFALVLARE
jgi:serine-type D-Ala-D-Ala carboxypeptidase/endopeptidase (penicillin-binding protein 4)